MFNTLGKAPSKCWYQENVYFL